MGIVQLNRTVVEFRKPSCKGRWKQGIVREVYCRRGQWMRVEDGQGKEHRVHKTWTRPRVKPIERPIVNALRRKGPQRPVGEDVIAHINKSHVRQWIDAKGGGNLETALWKANEMWQKELKEERVRNPQPCEFWN